MKKILSFIKRKRSITLKNLYVKHEIALNPPDKHKTEDLVITSDPKQSFYDTEYDSCQEQEDQWVSDFLGTENDVIADIIDSI